MLEKANKPYLVQRMMRALVYIQENLEEEIRLEDVAYAAIVSPYHFHRIFRGLTGEALHRLVQRMRLDKAQGLLEYTEETITEIALRSGYETSSAFAKAFRKTTGLTPQQYRTQVRFTKKNTFFTKEPTIMIPTITPLEIQFLEPLSVLFIRQIGPYEKASASVWDDLLHFASAKKVDVQKEKLIGISWHNPAITPVDQLWFDACISAPETIEGEGKITKQQIQGRRYAIFMHEGPYKLLSETFARIFTSWYPKSGEEVDGSPCLCHYLNRDVDRIKNNPETLRTKIYVPLKPSITHKSNK